MDKRDMELLNLRKRVVAQREEIKLLREQIEDLKSKLSFFTGTSSTATATARDVC